jgi:diacylglycerol kinase family enzyme
VKALLISNPTASRVTDARRRVVEHALAATFELQVASTVERGHAAELARDAAASGAEAIIVLGGDGTVNEAVNGLLASADTTDIVLGVLPGGGTNVLGRTMGYPRDLVEATGHLLELAEAGKSRRIGLGRLESTGRVFTFSAGLGLDADTVRRVEASGLRPRFGDAAFMYCCLRAFLNLRKGTEPPIVFQDGTRAWWAMITKSDPLTYLGGRPFRVAPEANHDRDLDLSAGLQSGLWRTMRWVSQALTTGRQVRHRDYLYLRNLPRVDISTKAPVPLQADGEYLGTVSELAVRSLPDALPVFS